MIIYVTAKKIFKKINEDIMLITRYVYKKKKHHFCLKTENNVCKKREN